MVETKSSPIPHPNQNTPTPHHSSPQPPQPTNLLPENKHAQDRRDEEVGRCVGDGDFGGGGGGREGAREEGPHDDVAEEV